jgi:hypothetical protein
LSGDDCTGGYDCTAGIHIHGCYSDDPCGHDDEHRRNGAVYIDERPAHVDHIDPGLYELVGSRTWTGDDGHLYARYDYRSRHRPTPADAGWGVPDDDEHDGPGDAA